MEFIIGFTVWLVIGVLAGFLTRVGFRVAGTAATLTIIFAIFGAFIGGMLGMSPYLYNDPVPLRTGGIIGSVAGALFFPYLYHFMARKAV